MLIGNVEWYKVGLITNGFTQKEGINYHETFSPVLEGFIYDDICISFGFKATPNTCENNFIEWGSWRWGLHKVLMITVRRLANLCMG